jgi:iron complex transport system substrate-binding protein
VQEKVANVQTKPLVFYELDSTDVRAPWTSGPGTFIDALLSMAGGRNVGSILKDPWAQISLEELVRQNPDLILLGDYTLGGVTPELVKQRTGWGTLAAVKNNKVYPFDDNRVSRPGPRLVDGLEALANLMHPELFK